MEYRVPPQRRCVRTPPRPSEGRTKVSQHACVAYKPLILKRNFRLRLGLPARMRLMAAASKPASLKRSRRFACVRREPSAPMWKASERSASTRAGRRSSGRELVSGWRYADRGLVGNELQRAPSAGGLRLGGGVLERTPRLAFAAALSRFVGFLVSVAVSGLSLSSSFAFSGASL
jgi:hypothetical protein